METWDTMPIGLKRQTHLYKIRRTERTFYNFMHFCISEMFNIFIVATLSCQESYQSRLIKLTHSGMWL